MRFLNTNEYNALSLAQPTDFKSMLKSGEILWGTGCRIPHEEAARIVASTPYHFCFIDAVGSLLLEDAALHTYSRHDVKAMADKQRTCRNILR